MAYLLIRKGEGLRRNNQMRLEYFLELFKILKRIMHAGKGNEIILVLHYIYKRNGT